jgi:hypothetical protein
MNTQISYGKKIWKRKLLEKIESYKGKRRAKGQIVANEKIA